MRSFFDTLLLVVPLAVAAVYIAYRAIARRPQVFRLSEYFLARGDIGGRMTTANALNNNFALGNILWLFIVWSYFFGPIPALLLEIPWCVGVYFVGRIAPVILESARSGQTLHGFLGSSYRSERLRVAAACVTATGYLLNFGFEVYVSSVIITTALGSNPSLKWVMAIVLALTTAAYISIAGFLGNVSQDRAQNRFGLAGVLLFACLVTATVLLSDDAPAGFTLTNFSAIDIGWPTTLGIIAYTSVFNLVDVSNWQGVGANMALPDERARREQRASWLHAAVGAWLFSCIGTWLGYLLRWKADLGSNDVFPELLGFMFVPGFPEILRTALLGLVVAAFFVLALGYAENLLSASQLTIMADVLRRREYDSLVAEEPGAQGLATRENIFVEKCQRTTFLMVISALVVFYLLMLSVGEQALLDFMFLIFGSAIGMFPAVIYAVRRRMAGKNLPGAGLARAAAASVLVGYLTSIAVPLLVPVLPSSAWLLGGVRTAEVAPFFALVFSFAVFHGLRRIFSHPVLEK